MPLRTSRFRGFLNFLFSRERVASVRRSGRISWWGLCFGALALVVVCGGGLEQQLPSFGERRALAKRQTARPPAMLEVHMLPVGQGDGLLIRTPSGKNVLVDMGPPEGGRVVLSTLKRLGIQHINLALVTHPHLDHYGGLPMLLRHINIRMYIDPGFAYSFPKYRNLLKSLRRRRIRMVQVRTGQVLALGGGIQLRILAPKLPFIRDTRSDANTNSIVMRLEYGRFRMLLTGDAEHETEELLLRRPMWLTSPVLKVAHHGSKHSSSNRFLRVVRPQVALVSCGKKNRYYHPHRSTLRRLRNIGARIFSTPRHGSVIVRSDGKKVWIATKGRSQGKSSMVFTLPRPPTDVRVPPPEPRKGRANWISPPERSGWLTIRPQGRRTRTRSYTKAKRGYIASRRSKVFHRRNCPFVRLIPKKMRRFYRTRRRALRARRRPASDCHP